VTGGAGFIGSNLVDALVARGDEVTVVDNFASGKREFVNSEATLLEHDIREPFSVDADVVFHLAAQADVQTSMKRPDYDAAVNVVGTVNVLQAARGAQVVFASSGGAGYGECDGPAREDAPLRPLAPYGTSKVCGEEYLATYNRLYGTGHVSLRLGNVYGPRQQPHGEAGVVAIFMGLLRDGGTPHVYGDGRQSRDYVYAGDVARSMLLALGRDGGVYNVGTGVETSVLDLYDAVQRAAGVRRAAEHAPPRLGELQRSVLDVSRAAAELGWRPEVSLADGLAATWAWITG
jgi:UDP-glucose 4-epimerase